MPNVIQTSREVFVHLTDVTLDTQAFTLTFMGTVYRNDWTVLCQLETEVNPTSLCAQTLSGLIEDQYCSSATAHYVEGRLGYLTLSDNTAVLL